MPEVVDSEPWGKAGALDCWFPDPPSEVGVAERLSQRLREDQGIGVVVDVSEEVLGHEFADKSRDHHHPTAVGLGGAEVQRTPLRSAVDMCGWRPTKNLSLSGS